MSLNILFFLFRVIVQLNAKNLQPVQQWTTGESNSQFGTHQVNTSILLRFLSVAQNSNAIQILDIVDIMEKPKKFRIRITLDNISELMNKLNFLHYNQNGFQGSKSIIISFVKNREPSQTLVDNRQELPNGQGSNELSFFLEDNGIQEKSHSSL